MHLLISALLFLSLITAFISAGSIKNIIEHFTSFILQIILCFYALLIANFVFISVVFGTKNLSAIISEKSFIYTPDDFCLFAVWFLFQVIICTAVIICVRLIDNHKKGMSILSFSKKQEQGLCALLFMSFAFIGITVSVKSWSETQLLINEVRSTGEVSLEEEEDIEPERGRDYIELYNPTPFNIKLSHFYVTDDLNEQPKQVAAKDIIPAGEYAVIYTAEGDNNFSISNDGDEIIYLLNSSESIIDSIEVSKLQKGTVYARDNSETGWGVYKPSPLEENSGDEITPVPVPYFSAESGFYDEPFMLKLRAPDGCRIYYTTDSSIPDENSILYENEIEISNVCEEPNVYRSIQNVVEEWKDYTPTENPVDKAVIIRAIVIDEQDNQSSVITKTYFVGMDDYKDKYILSLVTDPEDLFGEDGIYVTGKAYDEWYLGDQEEKKPTANFSRHGRDFEITAQVELFHDELLMSQLAGLRLQGGSNRTNALKRLMLYSRKEYSGSRYFDYDFFNSLTHSFLLRSDFADAFLQSLVPDRGIGGMKSLKVSVFLEGEFWYNTYLREKYSEDYLAQKYGADRTEVTFAEKIPEEIYTFLEEHDLSDRDDYTAFCNMIDIQNYIDFMVDNIYLCNMDLSETKNMRLWKTEGNSGIGYDDGRWRFLVYDMDCITWNSSEYYGIDSYGINSFSADHRFAGVAFDKETVFSALLTNDDFRRQFVLTFMDFVNTYFEQTNVERQLIEWGYDITWCKDFFAKRFDYIVPYLAKEFNLNGTLEAISLKLDKKNSGVVSINSVTPDISEGEWTGYYYTDYPVTISAIPAEGYKFIGWHHGDDFFEDPVMEVELTKGNNIWEAEFVKEN